MLRRWRSLLITRRGQFFPLPLVRTSPPAFTEPAGQRMRVLPLRRGRFFRVPIGQSGPVGWIEMAGARPRRAAPARRGTFFAVPVGTPGLIRTIVRASRPRAIPVRRGEFFGPLPVAVPLQLPLVPSTFRARTRPFPMPRRDGQFFTVPVVGQVPRRAAGRRRAAIAPVRRGEFWAVPVALPVAPAWVAPFSPARHIRPATMPRRDGQFFSVPAPVAAPPAPVFVPGTVGRRSRPLPAVRRDGQFFSVPAAAPVPCRSAARRRTVVTPIRRGTFWTVPVRTGFVPTMGRRLRPALPARRDGQFFLPALARPVSPVVPAMVRADAARLLPVRRGRFQPVPRAAAPPPSMRRVARPRPIARRRATRFTGPLSVTRAPWVPRPMVSRRPRTSLRPHGARFGRIAAGTPNLPIHAGLPSTAGDLHSVPVPTGELRSARPVVVGDLHVSPIDST